MDLKKEERLFTVALRSLRGDQEPDPNDPNEPGEGEVYGYAAVFNRTSQDLGGFREVIAPGAFDGVLMDDVRALINHDSNLVLGRNGRTLTLSTDETGLRFECPLGDRSYEMDLRKSMKRGDIDQCSFAFQVAAGSSQWEETDEGLVRTVTKISRLYDVSVVTYPAYTQTSADIRSYAEILSEAARAAKPAGVGVELIRRRFALLTI